MTARLLARLVAVSFLCLGSGAAMAACSAMGACSCTIGLTSVSFGNYDRLSSSPTDTVGNLKVECVSSDPENSTFTVAFSAGSSGNSNARAMVKGAYKIYYNLYTDAVRTVIWGDGSGSGQTIISVFPPSRGAKNFSIYGRIPALQNVPAGTYRDTITVTVTY